MAKSHETILLLMHASLTFLLANAVSPWPRSTGYLSRAMLMFSRPCEPPFFMQLRVSQGEECKGLFHTLEITLQKATFLAITVHVLYI
jgi:hypothetical protein